MRRVVFILGVVVMAACGGPQVPVHNGYKSEKAKPWKKPKPIALDDKGEAKVEGDLSYPDMRRAKWYAVDLPSNGQLSLKLEITPPGEAVNDDFDLAYEVLDPGFRVIGKSDLEDEDAHEVQKAKTLVDLAPGKYLVHLYLQGRMDTAEYVLRVAFKPTKASEVKSDFPAQVEFVPPLPMVALNDDTPPGYIKKPAPPRPPGGGKRPPPPPPPPGTKEPKETVTARIVGVSVGNGGVEILIGRGTDSKASNGMKATLKGISGAFEIGNCTPTTCRATIKGATADQIKAAGGTVVLTP